MDNKTGKKYNIKQKKMWDRTEIQTEVKSSV